MLAVGCQKVLLENRAPGGSETIWDRLNDSLRGALERAAIICVGKAAGELDRDESGC